MSEVGLLARLARLRVFLGFLSGALVLWLGAMRAPPQTGAPVAAASVVAAAPQILETEPLGFLLDAPSLGAPDFDSDPAGKHP